MKNKYGLELINSYVDSTIGGSYGNRYKTIFKCFCGAIKTIRSDAFENRKSCGCLKRGCNSKGWKGYKEISGEFWGKVKKDATSRNLDFLISIQYAYEKLMNQKHKCALSGLELKLPISSKEYKSYSCNASLDRINSKLGYIEDNIQWVDKRINVMKMDLPEEEFIQLCKLVSNTKEI